MTHLRRRNFKVTRRGAAPSSLAITLALVAYSSAVQALQPLSTFIDGADKSSPERLESAAVGEQRKAEEKSAKWRYLPNGSVTGSYTRNQYERTIMFPGSTEPEAFMATNQLDAALTLNIPIVNVAAWEQEDSSSALVELAEMSEKAVRQDLKRRVVRAYYQLYGSASLRQAAEENLRISSENADIVQDRRDAGAATELDVERAKSEVAKAQQNLASSQLAQKVAGRTLFSLTAIVAKEVDSFPLDNLQPEAPLEHWNRLAQGTPAVGVSQAARRVTESQTQVAKAAWYPTVTGTAQQRFTNATALVGHEAFYMFQLSVAWRFDGSNLYTSDAQRAALKAAEARESISQRDVDDAVFQAWHQVDTGIEKSRFARQQDESAEKAVKIAQQQYREGATTQLEVLAAQQAAFGAEVSRIQTDTDLAYARAVLRVVADQPIEVRQER